jgi:hypothetical protein
VSARAMAIFADPNHAFNNPGSPDHEKAKAELQAMYEAEAGSTDVVTTDGEPPLAEGLTGHAKVLVEDGVAMDLGSEARSVVSLIQRIEADRTPPLEYDQAEEELRNAWGSGYERRLAAARDALTRLLNPDLHEWAASKLEHPKFGNSVLLIKALANLSETAYSRAHPTQALRDRLAAPYMQKGA